MLYGPICDTAWAAIPARYALERGRWDEAAKLAVLDSQFPAAQSITYFLTVALLHQFGDPPDVDLRAHADRAVLSG